MFLLQQIMITRSDSLFSYNWFLKEVKSKTDFGIFIGLTGNIDGLVHLSDISWTEAGEEAVRAYNKSDEIETVILAIDSERERISLGIKQLDIEQFIQLNYLWILLCNHSF